MKHIKAPQNIPNKGRSIFLAGSIEMGKAELWQDRVAAMLKDTDWNVLNPRRDDWDSSWVQSKDHPLFREQVEWELQAMEMADTILFYFDPDTKAPITLLELGLQIGMIRGSAQAMFGHYCKKLIVVCPNGFYRKGNVDITCERYGIHQNDTLEGAMLQLKPSPIQSPVYEKED